MPVDIFISYAHNDKSLLDQLAVHLSSWKKRGIINDWCDGDIIPGTKWREQIQQRLHSAQVILLLVSSDFVASDFCYSKEMRDALARHKAGEARVVPILLRPVDYEGTPFANLTMLPSNGVPITKWDNIDAAFHDVERGMRRAVSDISPKDAPLSKTNSSLLSQPQAEIWNVPFEHNPYFTGRDEVLDLLHSRLKRGDTLHRPQVICGLGGIGKTQTALEYAYRFCQEYRYVLWVQANTPEILSTNFAHLANVLKLFSNDKIDREQDIKEVKGWLREHEKWLLILDNADDLEAALEMLPLHAPGHVLLTSRSQVVPSSMQSLKLGNMSSYEGFQFLLRRSMLLNQKEALERISADEQKMARRIVELLDGLPLALAQAGAYIDSTRCGLSGYIERYDNNAQRLLREERGLTAEHPNPVATTWSLSFQSVEKANPAAADLLRLCAFLHADAIPQTMITIGAKNLLPKLNVDQSNSGFNKAVEELLKYSLVSHEVNARTLSMHPLVQVVLREGLSKEEQRHWAERAVRVVSRILPQVDSTNWLNYEVYFPHAQVCADWIKQWNLMLPDAVHVLNQVGRYLEERGHYANAEPFYQRALRINEQQLGREDPETARSLNNLARLHTKLGQYGDAEPLAQRALQISEQTQKTEDPETADSLDNLAELYSDQGKYSEAEPLYKRALMIREQALGPEHPDVASSLYGLANLYRNQGRYSEAEPLYSRALTIYELQLGGHHPQTKAVRESYVSLLQKMGRDGETTLPKLD